VADIASVRFSLPAHLLEPRPNLGKSIRTALFDANRYLTELDNLQNIGTTSTDQKLSRGQYDILFVLRKGSLSDRQDHSIGKSDDPVGRMMEVLRFWFTKDLVWLQRHLDVLTKNIH
jgi:hypothetical protein